VCKADGVALSAGAEEPASVMLAIPSPVVSELGHDTTELLAVMPSEDEEPANTKSTAPTPMPSELGDDSLAEVVPEPPAYEMVPEPPACEAAALEPSLVNLEANETASGVSSIEASYLPAVADSQTTSVNDESVPLLEQTDHLSTVNYTLGRREDLLVPRDATANTDSPVPDMAMVVRIEWRAVRRTISAGLTSHSMLDVELRNGMRIRFEKFADTGVRESLLVPTIVYPKGSVYQGRVGKASDLVEPIRINELRKAAYALGATPYSLMRSNCHHFVRDLWNYLVVEPLRRYTHPDRIKAKIAVGISDNLGRFSIRTGFCLESRSMRSLGCRDAYNAFHSDGDNDD
jgi:hypothetical protein